MPIQFTENPQRNRSISFSASSRVIAGAGLREATQTEAEAGTISGKYMSPLRVAQALDGGQLSAVLTGLGLNSGSVVSWNSGDVTLTHSANTLSFAGASSGYNFDAVVNVATNVVINSSDPYIRFIDTDTNTDCFVAANNATGSLEFFADYSAEASSSAHNWYIDDSSTVRMTLNTTALTINLTTASISTITGALVVAGGVGVAGAVYTGDQITSAKSTNGTYTGVTISNPNTGASANAGFRVLNNLGASNGMEVGIYSTASGLAGDGFVQIYGAYNMRFYANGTEHMRLSSAGSIVLGAQAALNTNATDGFVYIPTCAGTPSGTPTAYTGKVAMVFDTTNNKLYIYDGSWLGGTTPGAFV